MRWRKKLLGWVAASVLLAIASSAMAGGRVIAWGDPSDGKTSVPSDLTNVVAIAAGAYHSLALKADGTVSAWGLNNRGQCAVPSDLSNVVQVAGGFLTSLALKADGSLVAWGASFYGEGWVPALTNIVQIAAGHYFNLALLDDGRVIAWGLNDYGQTAVPGGSDRVVDIAAGSLHGLALRGNGMAVGWGVYFLYPPMTPYEPATVVSAAVPAGSGRFVDLAAGGGVSAFLRADGTVASDGYHFDGQDTAPMSLLVPAGLSKVEQLAVGNGYTLALKTDGSVTAWGWPPTNPPALSGVVRVAAGIKHALALVGESPPAPRLIESRLQSGAFSVRVSTVCGTAYRLEYKTALDHDPWIMLTPLPGDGSVKTLLDTAPTAATRFYRVRRL